MVWVVLGNRAAEQGRWRSRSDGYVVAVLQLQEQGGEGKGRGAIGQGGEGLGLTHEPG